MMSDKRYSIDGVGPLVDLDGILPALREVFARNGVELAYLYGSQARGDPGPLSDIDIAVLFPATMASGERFQRLLTVMGELADIFKRDDVFVADLADATPLLRHQVYKEGRLLYGRDDKVRVKFMTEAARDYIDTEPLRRIQRQYLKQHIKEGTFGRLRTALAEKKEKYDQFRIPYPRRAGRKQSAFRFRRFLRPPQVGSER